MEKVKANGWTVVFLALIALMCSHVIFGDADNWNPPGPPAPTMKSLDAIYNAVESMSPSISQREGYCRKFSCPSNTETTLLAVPAGRRFVLRKLWVANTGQTWEIFGDPNDCHIHCTIVYTGDPAETMWDFPDGCVVVEGPNDLTFHSTAPSVIWTTVVGYLYDVP